MSKCVKQYRYYKDNDERNYPTGISKVRLASGSMFFSDGTLPSISQLGIQTLPGVKFFLNDSVEPIIIGSTGIYELDLEGVSEITSLMFDQNSLTSISQLDNPYIIIDAIYNVEE